MDLTRENVAGLSQPLYQVWNAIGPDIYDIDEEVDPESVIEWCIDADRLTFFVEGDEGRAAQDLVRSLIAEHGYTKVLKFLAKTFPMC